MTETTKKPQVEVQEAISAKEDLSEAIAAAVQRQSDEEVKVVRLFDDRYRCNFWVREKSAQAMFLATSGTIRRSKFFRAHKTVEGVVMEDLSQR